MPGYKLLEHTADARILVRGRSREELFLLALAGMNKIMAAERDERAEGRKMTKRLNLKAPDLTGLLIDFLSAVLTQAQEQKAVFGQVEFAELTDQELKARIYGRPVSSFREDIKAVTYHEAAVRKNKTGELETIIVFDI